jgi:hypothetical protein
MRFPGVQNKKFSAAAWLLLWSIGLRLIVYFLLPPAKEIDAYDYTDQVYFSALTERFNDYIFHITFIPPASYIINAAVFMVLGIQTALHIRGFIILVFLMHTVAVMLLYDAVKKTGTNNRYSFILLCIFSAILVPFALWRESMHYDVHTIFFAAFFAWSLVRLMQNSNSYSSLFWVSISAGLLVSQSAVNSAIAPVTILLVLLALYLPLKQFRKLGTALVITLILPVAILFAISKKNQVVGEEALTSNKAGPAMMMVVQRAYNYDTAKIRSAIIACKVPEWYLWTYDHASGAHDKKTGEFDKLFFTLSQAFGICYYDENLVGKQNIFGFDFHPLLNQLRTDSSLQSYTKMAEEDSVDALYKPYRLAGYSPSLSPRWIGVYGKVSQKIFYKTLLRNPVGMIRSFIIQQGIYSIYGPLFPFNIMRTETNILVRSGLRTLTGKMPLDPMFALFALVFAVISWIIYAISIINIPLSALQLARSKISFIKDLPKNYFLLISIPLILNALVYSCLVGGENDRYFMQVTPYIILLAALLPGLYKTARDRSTKTTSDFFKP